MTLHVSLDDPVQIAAESQWVQLPRRWPVVNKSSAPHKRNTDTLRNVTNVYFYGVKLLSPLYVL